MDLLTPGITPHSRQSVRDIRIINNNNRISLAIRAKFGAANAATTAFLTSDLASYTQSAGLKSGNSHSPLQNTYTSQFHTLSTTFEQIYSLLGVEDFKFDRIATLDLASLHHTYKPIATITAPPESTNEFVEINSSLNDLINRYVLLTLGAHLANSTIYRTLILKSNLAYWENLHTSTTSKWIYFVQTLPSKTFELSWAILDHVRFRLESNTDYEFSSSAVSEDNPFYNNWVRCRHWARVAWDTARVVLGTLFVQNDPSISLLKISSKISSVQWYKKVARHVLRAPLSSVNHQITDKITAISREIEQSTAKLDYMIGMKFDQNLTSIADLEYLVNSNQKDEILDENSRVDRLIKCVNDIASDYSSSGDQPSFLTRYWVPLALLIAYGPGQTLNAYHNREAIIHWFKHNFIDTVYGFFKNWVVKPIGDMLNILRHDDELSITSKESLKSDLDSLERMVLDFAKDEHVANLDPQQIHNAIQSGDLTLLMSKYESQLRSPVKNILRGSLIRSLLIQVQKTKVDGGVAINGIDKLLKSQQLVFGIVSISPSVFIIYKLWQYAWGAKPISVNGKQVNVLCLKGLNNIEGLLINNRNNKNDGSLLVETVNLVITAQLLIPKELKKDWERDLNELNNPEHSVEVKLDIVKKIWNTYGYYFR